MRDCKDVVVPHTPGSRLGKSRHDLARKTGESVCLSLSAGRAGRAFEPRRATTLAILFHSPSFFRPSSLSSHRELRHRRKHPIGVSLSNEGGHHAPLLALGESILGIHSPPHSSTPSWGRNPVFPPFSSCTLCHLRPHRSTPLVSDRCDSLSPSHGASLQCISPPAFSPFAPDISK